MILYIIAAIVIYIVFFSKSDEKETFVADATQTQLAKNVVKFVKSDTTFPKFLDFLVKNNNTSYKLLKQETFYELKFLQKGNKLTQNAVMQYMDD
jgi:hypothetical protein